MLSIVLFQTAPLNGCCKYLICVLHVRHFCITCESALKDSNIVSTEIYLVLLLLDLSNKIKGGALSMGSSAKLPIVFLIFVE